MFIIFFKVLFKPKCEARYLQNHDIIYYHNIIIYGYEGLKLHRYL